MSKNMTQRSLAIGAGFALLASGFAGVPAQAAGLADTSFVQLAPSTGTEYTVLASASGTGATFSLTANESVTVSTGNLKFLVTDPNSLVEPDSDSTTRSFTLTLAGVGTTAVPKEVSTSSAKVVTVKFTNTLAKGDLISFDDDLKSTSNTTRIANRTEGPFEVLTADSGEFTFQGGSSTVASAAAVSIGANRTIKVLREARNSAKGTFVVDSAVSSAATEEVLNLIAASANTSSATVQAWMDANSNDKLDSTEYASPVRTVTFKKASDVVALTTLTPIVGDKNLVAKISTTPVLNGEQTLAFNPAAINAKFSRSLSSSLLFGNNEAGGGSGPTSVWNNTDKNFTVSVNLDANAADKANVVAGTGAVEWADISGPSDRVTAQITTVAIRTTNIAEITTITAHALRSGDKVTVTSVAQSIAVANEANAVVTVTGATSFTYKMTETTAPSANASVALSGAGGYTVETYATDSQGLSDRAGAETYSATATVAAVSNGATATTGVNTAVSATTTIATSSSATVQGLSFSANGANDVKVLKGTLSVPVTITVTDSDKKAVGAGRAVALSIAKSGTADSFKINGKSADTVLTDANGQISAEVTATAGNSGAILTLTALAENLATAQIVLKWESASYGLIDLAGTAGTLSTGNQDRNMIKLGTYDLDLMVADQWFNVPAAGTYRLNVSGEGVSARYVSFVDGKATVTVTDTGVFDASVDAIVKLEKLSGTTVASSTTFTFQSGLATSYAINAGAAGSTLYGNTVVASAAVAKKALVEIDNRTESTATPAYVNNLVLNGQVSEKANSSAKAGAVVTVSGPSNILFKNDQVAKRGSLTLFADSNGKFEVQAYSTTAQKDSVVTFTTIDGATATIKVTFTGIGVGEGTSFVITTPGAVKPASTFQVKAKLTDAFGNGVSASAGRVKVTYTGAGIIFGTLPTSTDANGELQFSVLLGSNDTGTVSVTVSYDQNGDKDFTDAKDLNTSASIAINATGTAASTDTKVNAGSFKGYVAVYAKGYEGKRLSAKIGNDWVIVPSLASSFERIVDFTGAGVDISVRIYIDRVLLDTIELTTK